MRQLPFAALVLSLAAAAPAAAFTAFESPSGNIGCYVDRSAGARCDVAKREWTVTQRPRGCPADMDFGQGMIVNRGGRGHVVCAGDTALLGGDGPVLAYGQSRTEGRYRCTSRRSGMRCVNRRNGHGFVVSRERYRLF